MDPAALPAPTTGVRPRGGGGRCAGTIWRGSAAERAALKLPSRSSRVFISLATFSGNVTLPPVNSSKSGPPPFWQQLPRVFTYPMHGDAMVKIVAFALFVAITSHIGFLAYILSRIACLAFMAYCFRILERTARGHLVPGDYVDDRTNKDSRPLMQVGIIFVLMLFAIMVGIFMGKIAGQIALILV